jgi:hypothetical protein
MRRALQRHVNLADMPLFVGCTMIAALLEQLEQPKQTARRGAEEARCTDTSGVSGAVAYVARFAVDRASRAAPGRDP